MKKITDFDRFIIYLDRVLAVLAASFFLWVENLQVDFVALLLGIASLIGWFFTSRYLIRLNKQEPEQREGLEKHG